MTRSARRFLAAALAVVLAAALCSAFFVQLLLIHGDSMAPAYRSGSLVLLDKHPAAYESGDVVLCRSAALGRSVVKRIAAAEGDALNVEGGALYINGEYRGVYLFSEKVEIQENRIAVRDLEAVNEELRIPG